MLHRNNENDNNNNKNKNDNNKVAGYIHWTICNHMRLQVTDKYYEHLPEKVINISGTTIMWDIAVTKIKQY
jgi:hypothetical protein